MSAHKNFLQILHWNNAKLTQIGFAGLFGLLCMLSGCQSALSPTQTATAFWNAMKEGDLESVREYTTQESQYLVTKQQHLEGVSFKTEEALIDGHNAKVATVITQKNKLNSNVLSFDTVLSKENNLWKVDYRQTINSLSFLPFGEVFNSLRAIGDVINKKLEEQLPFLENQIESISEELIRQLDDFRRQLEKSNPPEDQLLPPV